MDTLELLEAQLVEFPGTVILISHDREFLDHVAGSVFFLDGEGGVHETIGGFSDWRREGGLFPTEQPAGKAGRSGPASGTAERSANDKPATPRNNKLSYKYKRELEQLPERIRGLEQEVEDLNARISTPDFYEGDPEEVQQVLGRLSQAESELETAMERWVELEEMAG
ncbi:hypothetical protein [Halospina denitrificans]|uniref:hypothetical protein n=1 Tax=Halospina denitrificans TaxID=332522 RepID=UPI003C7DA9C8